MDYPKFIVSNQKEESISIQRVNNINVSNKNESIYWQAYENLSLCIAYRIGDQQRFRQTFPSAQTS